VTDPISLYLHYPFCRNRCSYCDFYKETYDSERQRRFADVLTIETELAIARHGLSGRTVETIFIGGGTPSLIEPELLSRWVDQLRSLLQFSESVEFSIECNPESVDPEKLECWQALGINRPVFGMQSFNTSLLTRLGRKHYPRDSQRAVYHANALGYRNFGVDLIFGLPGQTMGMMSSDIDEVLALAPPHISFYQLTVEPGTELASRIEAGKLREIDDETALGMYRGGSERLIESDYIRYKVSSFAKAGFECRHNLGYWTGREYLGLGPAAHSFIASERYFNPSDLDEYTSALDAGRLPARRDESGPEERMTEAVLVGLRLARGISRREFVKRFGVPLDDRLNRSQYDILTASEHLIDDEASLRLSDEGVYLADQITRRLVR